MKFNALVFANRLRELMEEKGLSIRGLAEAVYLTPGTISKYLTSKLEPRRSTIEVLSLHFKVNPAWLMGLDTEKYLNKNEFINIPVVGHIRAGEPILAQQNVIEYISIPAKMAQGKDVFGLKIIGDSMNNARIYEGDTVIVEQLCEVENGEMAVVLIDDENATVKRFYKTNSTVTLVPESSNPDHKPKVYDIKKINIKVLGKVIGALINL